MISFLGGKLSFTSFFTRRSMKTDKISCNRDIIDAGCNKSLNYVLPDSKRKHAEIDYSVFDDGRIDDKLVDLQYHDWMMSATGKEAQDYKNELTRKAEYDSSNSNDSVSLPSLLPSADLPISSPCPSLSGEADPIPPTTKWRKIGMASKLVTLRELTMHPYIIRPKLTDDGYYVQDEELVTASGKMLVLDQLCLELKKNNHKVLIFSQMTQMLDICANYCEWRDFKYERLDGRMQFEEREAAMDSFNNDPDMFIMLLSTRAGGLGLNLVSADTVIIYDSDWNPQADLQAQDRCHRIGQTRPVVVFRLISKNSIDERILHRAQNKRRLEKLVIRQDGHSAQFDNSGSGCAKLTKAELEEELEALLQSTDFEHELNLAADEDKLLRKLIPDDKMAILMDRSDMVAGGKKPEQEQQQKTTKKSGGSKKSGKGEANFEIIVDYDPDTAVAIG